MNNGIFYRTAYDLIGAEVLRFEKLCGELDESKAEKSARMAEYKSAKYRLSALRRVYNMLFHGKNVIENGCIHIDIENALNSDPGYSSLYEEAAEEEKKNFKLYYGIKAYTENKISELNEKLPLASDWERVELTERIGGFEFAVECLNQAWQSREDVSL